MIAFAYYASVYATIKRLFRPAFVAQRWLSTSLPCTSWRQLWAGLDGQTQRLFCAPRYGNGGASAMNEHFRAAVTYRDVCNSRLRCICLCVLLVAARTVPEDMDNLRAWMSSPAAISMRRDASKNGPYSTFCRLGQICQIF